MTRSRWMLAAAAAVCLALTVGFYMEMFHAPAPCCGLAWPMPDPVQAERAMAAADPRGRSPDAQQTAATALIASRPAEFSAWLRLAYADRLQHGVLTARGRRALEVSYLVLPYAG